MRKFLILCLSILSISALCYADTLPNSITQLNINNRIGNVLLTFSSSNEYSITSTVINTQNNKEQESATNLYPAMITVKNGIATVETTLPEGLNLSDVLTVSIPASSPLKIITATSEIGNINFSNIMKNSVQIVLFNANMGDISIQNNPQAALKSLTILNGMGKIAVQNLPEKCSLKIEDDMGNVVLQNMPQNSEMSILEKMGDIVYIGDTTNIDATVKQGDIVLDNKKVSQSQYSISGSSELPQKVIINDMGDVKITSKSKGSK